MPSLPQLFQLIYLFIPLYIGTPINNNTNNNNNTICYNHQPIRSSTLYTICPMIILYPSFLPSHPIPSIHHEHHCSHHTTCVSQQWRSLNRLALSFGVIIHVRMMTYSCYSLCFLHHFFHLSFHYSLLLMH